MDEPSKRPTADETQAPHVEPSFTWSNNEEPSQHQNSLAAFNATTSSFNDAWNSQISNFISSDINLIENLDQNLSSFADLETPNPSNVKKRKACDEHKITKKLKVFDISIAEELDEQDLLADVTCPEQENLNQDEVGLKNMYISQNFLKILNFLLEFIATLAFHQHLFRPKT